MSTVKDRRVGGPLALPRSSHPPRLFPLKADLCPRSWRHLDLRMNGPASSKGLPERRASPTIPRRLGGPICIVFTESADAAGGQEHLEWMLWVEGSGPKGHQVGVAAGRIWSESGATAQGWWSPSRITYWV